MKSRPSNFSKNNDLDVQFKSLNNDEMNSLRGGTEPPLPPSGGSDYPIDPYK